MELSGSSMQPPSLKRRSTWNDVRRSGSRLSISVVFLIPPWRLRISAILDKGGNRFSKCRCLSDTTILVSRWRPSLEGIFLLSHISKVMVEQ